MHFKDFLQNTAKGIDKELGLFFDKWIKDAERVSSRLLPLADALAESCRGGKRIRGALVKLGYEVSLFNGKRSVNRDDEISRDEILKIASAFEIFQTAILIHDDIIDKSKYRRGKLSLYEGLGGDHAGKSLAICLGDIGFFLAFQLIARSGFSEVEKNRALSIFSSTMLETGIGELLDVELASVKGSVEIPEQSRYKSGQVRNENSYEVRDDRDQITLNDIITVYKFKTAYYTIAAPLLLGAVLGGLDDSSLSAIKIFGQNLGIAFQIKDDINDIFFDKKRSGKEVGEDIREGKQTMLYLYAKGHANKKQNLLLRKYYGNSKIGAKEIGVVKKVLVETGALDYARSEAKRYSQTAKKSIPKITQSDGFRKIFFEMAEYFVK